MWFKLHMLMVLGSMVGWSICAIDWIESGLRSTDDIESFFIVCGTTFVGACCAWSLRVTPRFSLWQQLAFIVLGAILGWLGGPVMSSSYDSRVTHLFSDPFSAFRPTSVAFGAAIGGIAFSQLPKLKPARVKLNRWFDELNS